MIYKCSTRLYAIGELSSGTTQPEVPKRHRRLKQRTWKTRRLGDDLASLAKLAEAAHLLARYQALLHKRSRQLLSWRRGHGATMVAVDWSCRDMCEGGSTKAGFVELPGFQSECVHS